MPVHRKRPPAHKLAMERIELQLEQREKARFDDLNKRLAEIGKTQGLEARYKAEEEYQKEKAKKDAQLMKDVYKLQYELLDQGICPWSDTEGFGEVFKLRTGYNLEEFPGTKQFSNYMAKSRDPAGQTFGVRKKTNRAIIKILVEELKSKGIDPVDHFGDKRNGATTLNILNLTPNEAERKLAEYTENMEKYGQTIPALGTNPSFKDNMKDPQIRADIEAKKKALEEKRAAAAAPVEDDQGPANKKGADKAAKEKAKAEAKAAKEKAKAEKEKVKAEAKAAKEKAKEEKRLEKEAAKAAKAAAAAAAAAATTAATSEMAAAAADVSGTAIDSATSYVDNGPAETAVATAEDGEEEEAGLGIPQQNNQDDNGSSKDVNINVKKPSASKNAAVAVGLIGGAVVIRKVISDRAGTVDEAERQRQFKMLMGITDGDGSDSPFSAGDDNDDDFMGSVDVDLKTKKDIKPEPKAAKSESSSASPSSTDTPKKKKKKVGLGKVASMFTAKNTRETDLNVLISEGATAPELSKLLAKLLTFGAPGRFPLIAALPGGMPMEEFELEKAVELLEKSFEESGITRQQGAEVFGDVVNCMMVDMIDLASSSLAEKDEVVFDAVNIVVEFMNHASSMYDAVAKDATIKTVTYSGSLPKSQLEKLYARYSVHGTFTVGDTDIANRGDLIRTVFGISEKKADGVVSKLLMKKLAEGGSGLEGMEEMMKQMGGMGDMNGLGGMGDMMNGLGGMGGGADGAEPDMNQVKEMLKAAKQMKDAGQIPPKELETVRAQFKEAFGDNIDGIMKQAESGEVMPEADQELLDLMKSILED